MAVAAWGHVLATRHIDPLIAVETVSADELAGRLTSSGFRLRQMKAISDAGGARLIPMQFSPLDSFLDIRIDLFLAESKFHRMAIGRRVMMPLPSLSQEVAVVACEDLIVLKLLAGRIIDRVDATMLLRINHARLDHAYMAGRARRLDLEQPFEEIRREAFPG